MGTLSAALAWAQRGFLVFPIVENGKVPVSDNWVNTATVDEEAIRALWSDPVLKTERNYNIGVLCSNMVVIDIDVKNGKDGFNQYDEVGGHYDTLTVKTVSGGFHCYFRGPDSANAPLNSGVDVRSHNGYVLAPGSTIDGVAYQIIDDMPMAELPETIRPLLRSPYERLEIQATHELDTPAAIDAAIRYLQSERPAIEGMGGDSQTYITACRLVREMALSVDKAYELMSIFYNPRCSPPWEAEELYLKIQNAAAYGTADMGRLTPEVLFAGVVVAKPPNIFEQSGLKFGNAVLPDEIPPRDWLIERMLLRKAVTIITASGSAGKSTIGLTVAAHLAVGKSFHHYTTRYTNGSKIMIYNGEDDIAEQSRRLAAICLQYKLDFSTVTKNIMLVSSRELKLEVAYVEGQRPVRNDVICNHLTELARENECRLIIVDPLVKIHKCNESDNVHMDFVMETLTDLAHDVNAAVMVIHHASKGGGQQDNRVGNPDNARGASAIINAARIAFTLLTATQRDAEEYGLTDEQRQEYVRLDDAKMNLTLADKNAKWFRKIGVQISPNNPDLIGVLYPHDLTKSVENIKDRYARNLYHAITSANVGSLGMVQAITYLKASDPILKAKNDKDIKDTIVGFFTTAVSYNGKSIQYVPGEDGAKAAIVLN